MNLKDYLKYLKSLPTWLKIILTINVLTNAQSVLIYNQLGILNAKVIPYTWVLIIGNTYTLIGILKPIYLKYFTLLSGYRIFIYLDILAYIVLTYLGDTCDNYYVYIMVIITMLMTINGYATSYLLSKYIENNIGNVTDYNMLRDSGLHTSNLIASVILMVIVGLFNLTPYEALAINKYYIILGILGTFINIYYINKIEC